MRAAMSHPDLFAAHDRDLIKLPADLMAERDALRRLLEHQLPASADPATEHQSAVDSLLTAAHGTDDLLTRVDVAGADADRLARQHAANALTVAREHQAASLRQMVFDMRDQIIADVLAPVHAEMIKAARSRAALLVGIDLSSRAVARADAKTRAALAEVGDLAERYAVLRSLWARMFELEPTTQHVNKVRLLGWVKNLDALGIAPGSIHSQVGATPWPGEPLDRLLWFGAHPEVEPWMPTPAEHDQLVERVFADGIENQRRARWATEATRAGASV